jgi:hypothetical protein
MRRRSSSIFINAFLDLPQNVSASHCHHQGVVVSSEATQAVCIVDVCGLFPVQSCQLSMDVEGCYIPPQLTTDIHPQYRQLE